MTLPFIILALLILGSGIAAITLRNLVHCALCLSLSFLGLAGAYLLLNAQFAGFAQILVYVGAVAILIVFAILLTRGSEPAGQAGFSPQWLAALASAVAVVLVLGGAILSSHALPAGAPATPDATVRKIGEELMGRYVLPLEVLGLLLTAALIGAVIVALRERSGR